MGVLSRILRENKIKPDDPELINMLNFEKSRIFTEILSFKARLDEFSNIKKNLLTKISLKELEISEIEKSAGKLVNKGDIDKARELFVVSAGLNSAIASLKNEIDKLLDKTDKIKKTVSEYSEDISEIDNIKSIFQYQGKVAEAKKEIGRYDDKKDDLLSKMKRDRNDQKKEIEPDFSDPDKFAEEKINRFKSED